MKYFTAFLLILTCYGCAIDSVTGSANTNLAPKQPATHEQSGITTQCPGNTKLPAKLTDKFDPIEDEDLLQMALGQPEKGGLCQGQVYQTKTNTHVMVYRAWNSTNPNSKMGNWWAFQIPEGKVSQYRSDYEICYQWSPLDKLTHCTLKANAKIVIGTGQSAECSSYLSYPASTKTQIYIRDPATSVADCTSYDGEFSWKATTE